MAKPKTSTKTSQGKIVRIIRAKLNFGWKLTPAEAAYLKAHPEFFGGKKVSSGSGEDRIIYRGGSREIERGLSTRRALEESTMGIGLLRSAFGPGAWIVP